MTLSLYSIQPHAQDCDCSVCWSQQQMATLTVSQSEPCDQCRRASAQRTQITAMRCVGGVWIVTQAEWQITPAFTCEKHTPSDRPPKYWSVLENIGKPVPFVPLHEPFELVG
ncbi:MAG: lysogeny maintenance protein PflM [Pseudomonadales bacterium]|uniref:lysogeny maintenance protein PflM n=1 Tax=Pseudomonas peli TaxID=592361 RepID=UPI0031F6C335